MSQSCLLPPRLSLPPPSPQPQRKRKRKCRTLSSARRRGNKRQPKKILKVLMQQQSPLRNSPVFLARTGLFTRVYDRISLALVL